MSIKTACGQWPQPNNNMAAKVLYVVPFSVDDWTPCIWPSRTRAQRQAIVDYRRAMCEVAEQTGNRCLKGPNAIMAAGLTSGNSLQDMVHPTALGHATLAKAIAQILNDTDRLGARSERDSLRFMLMFILFLACGAKSDTDDANAFKWTGGDFQFQSVTVDDSCLGGALEAPFMPEGPATPHDFEYPLHLPGDDELPASYTVDFRESPSWKCPSRSIQTTGESRGAARQWKPLTSYFLWGLCGHHDGRPQPVAHIGKRGRRACRDHHHQSTRR